MRGRRWVIILLVLVVVNTALEWANRQRFPTRTVTSQAAAADDPAVYFPHTYWVLVPGFGIDFCADVEAALAPVLHTTGQSFCVAPSPVTLDPHEIAAAIRARVDAHRAGEGTPVTLRFYGISMGGMIAFDVARILDGRHRIRVAAVVFDSSPAGPGSVAGVKQLGPRWGALVNRLPNLPGDIPNPLKGGPLNRMAVHTGEALAGDLAAAQWPSLADLSLAWHKSTAVTSGRVANQLAYIEQFYRSPLGDELAGARFGYLRADDPRRDNTVDVVAAIDTYRTLVPDLRVYAVRDGGHAGADQLVAQYRAALAAFTADAGLTTVTDILLERTRPRHQQRLAPVAG